MADMNNTCVSELSNYSAAFTLIRHSGLLALTRMRGRFLR